MAPEVVTVTRETLEARRAELLRSLGLTLDEWKVFAATRTLNGDEWAIKEELDQIEFLLGDAAE